MMHKKKTLPSWVENVYVARFLQSKAGVLLSYWLCQGMLYMDIRETVFKIGLDILLTTLFWSWGAPFLLAVILAHTVNMLVNGHFFAMRSHMGLGKIEPVAFIAYIEKLHSRIRRQPFLLGAAAYGSLSRNLFKPTSDLDIRVFPRKGFLSWPKAVLWVFIERFRALINYFPLDMYAFDFDSIDAKMKADEPPIIFLDPEGHIARKYDNHVKFGEFSVNFKAKHLRETGD
jgi:hypothetical protein